MKKRVLIILIFTLLVGKAFSFQIGMGIGYSAGSSFETIKDTNNQTIISPAFFESINSMFMIPHHYGNSNWGGSFEFGFINLQLMPQYLVNYTFNVDSFKISPFIGGGAGIMEFTGFVGCSLRYPIWIGDIYCDLRIIGNYGVLNDVVGGINVGSVFCFGKDRK